MVNLRVLVLRKDELDSDKVVDFVSSFSDARLILFFSSVDDEFLNLDFFEGLVGKIKVPWLGARVVYCASNEGYVSDVVVVCVLCGIFDAGVFSVVADYDKTNITADAINSTVGDNNLMVVFSSNTAKKDSWINHILKLVQHKNPHLQIFGGVCGSPPFVVTNEGIFEDRIGYALLRGVDFDFVIDSGFSFDKESTEQYVVTKSDDCYILELDGKNASTQYSKIQHFQPYFLNMLTSLFVKSNFTQLMLSLSRTNKVMYEGIIKFVVKLLGREAYPGVVELLACFELGVDHLLAQVTFPNNTVLRRITSTPEDQLRTYDRLYSKAKDAKALLISSCLMRTYWSDFQFDKVKEKLKQFKCPVVLVDLWGELGIPLPPKNKDENLLHGGTMKSLIIK